MTAFAIISFVRRSRTGASTKPVGDQSEEDILAEKRQATFAERDREEKQEAARRQEEWEEVESSALAGGGLRRMPEEAKRSRIGESTIGGVSYTQRSHKKERLMSRSRRQQHPAMCAPLHLLWTPWTTARPT